MDPNKMEKEHWIQCYGRTICYGAKLRRKQIRSIHALGVALSETTQGPTAVPLERSLEVFVEILQTLTNLIT